MDGAEVVEILSVDLGAGEATDYFILFVDEIEDFFGHMRGIFRIIHL